MNNLAVSLNHTHSMFLNPTSPDARAQNVLYSGQSINKYPLSMQGLVRTICWEKFDI